MVCASSSARVIVPKLALIVILLPLNAGFYPERCFAAGSAEAAAEPANSDADRNVSTTDESATGNWLTNWQARLRTTLRLRLGPALKAWHGPLDRWLASLPMSVAVACAVGLYAAAVIWVWTLRREFVFRGAPDQHWWRDLRIWATLVVMPYIAIYLILGR